MFSPSPDVPKAIERALDETERSIDLAMYSFSDRRLQTRVKRAAERGLKIRVILHDADGKALSKSLEDVGADVRYVTQVMHHKFAILDGPQAEGDDPAEATLLTGSGNWSRSSYSRYDDDLLVLQDEPDIVQAFQREFNLIWGHSRNFGQAIHGPSAAVDGGSKGVLFTSANLKPSTYRGKPTYRTAVSLEDGVCGRRLIEAIDSAESTIEIATAHFRRKDIHDALKRALGRGVKVRLLLDQQEYHSERTSISNARHDEALAKAGVEVRYKVYAPYWDYKTALQMHCKFMIVDSAIVQTGSFNWSENSELRSFENLLTVRQPEVVGKYTARFEMMWRYGEGTRGKVLAAIKEKDGRGPCFFKPIAMTGGQLVELRGAYRGGACR